jgi:hypothetical protein
MKSSARQREGRTRKTCHLGPELSFLETHALVDLARVLEEIAVATAAGHGGRALTGQSNGDPARPSRRGESELERA